MSTADLQSTTTDGGVLPPAEEQTDGLWRPDTASSEEDERPASGRSGWSGIAAPTAVLLLTVAAGVLRSLDAKSFWIDEAISWYQANLPYSVMIQDLAATDVHPPLWATVMWVTVRVLGDGEFALRLPSILAGAATVPVLYAAGREVSSRATGLVAATLFALAPLAVWYGSEARMYAFFMLFTSASVWLLLRAVRTRRWSDWAGFAVAAALLLYTQWFALLPVAVMVAAVAGLLLVRRRRGLPVRQLAQRAGAAVAGIALLCAPLVPLLAAQLASYGERSEDAAPAQAGQVSGQQEALSLYAPFVNVAWLLVGFHDDEVMRTLVALWPLTLVVFLGVLGRGRTGRPLLLVGLAIVPPTVLFVVGLLVPRVFEVRYFIGSAPAVALLVALAMTSWSRRTGTVVALTALLAAGSSIALYDQMAEGENPRRYAFRTAIGAVREASEPGDLLLYAPAYLDDVVDYYDPGIRARPLETLAQNAPPDGATVYVMESFSEDPAVAELVGRSRAELEQVGYELVGRQDEDNVIVWEYQQ